MVFVHILLNLYVNVVGVVWYITCSLNAGVIPLSLFFVKAGTMLQELTDVGVTSVASVYTLILFAVISTVPIIFQSHLKSFLSD